MATQKRITILLIEDSPSDTRLIKESLRDAPHGRFSVITASTLAEGLSKLEQAKIDAILLDLALPDSDGIATFHAVRKLTSLPIVVLTMTDDDVLGLQMVHEGAQDYLPKTVLTQEISTTALTRAIRYAIERMHIRSELRHAHEQMETLNERLQSANKQLRIVNEELSDGVQARTEELDAANEELRVTNEELRREVEHRTHSERVARQNAERTELINRIITLGNEFADMRSYVAAMLDLFVNELAFDTASVRFREGDVIKMYDSRGFSAELVTKMQEEDISTSPFNRIYAGEPYLDEAYADTDPAIAREARIETALGIPLIAYDRIIGHFGLGSRRKRPFTNAELQTLIAIGREAGTVITRLQAEEAVKEHARRQDILTDVISIGNQAPDVRTACAAMLDAAMDLMHVSHGSLYLLNEAEGMIERQYARGYSQAVLDASERFPLTTSFYPQLYAGKAKFLNDYQKQGTEQLRRLAPELNVVAAVPLVAEHRVIGNYMVGSTRTAPFTAEEETLLVAIGQQAGTVISRLQAEEALKEGETRYRRLVERSFDAVIIHSDGVIRFANDATARILKAASPADLVGMNILDLPSPRFQELAKRRMSSVYTTKQSSEPAEFEYRALDGTIIETEVMGTPITYDNKPAIYVVFRDISERKRMEAQLKQYSERLEALVEERTAQLAQREESFRTLFEASSVGQIHYDANGHPTRINRAAATFFGINDVSDIQHLTIFSSPQTSEGDKARLRAGRPVRYEHVYDFKEITERGSFHTTRSDVRYVDLYMLPIFNTLGDSVEGYLAQLVDITELKQVEAALQASEAEYRTLVETANSSIFTLDTEGTITYVNEFGAHSLGYTPDELIGQNVMVIVPDVESSGRDMTPYIDDIVARPDDHTLSVNENITKDGRRLWFNWVNKILTDEEGRHIGHLAMGYDVTEQLRAQQALQDSEERYRTLVETAHSVILTVDNHGIVTFINDYGARFFGYMPDELIGKHTMILVPPVDSSGHDLTAHINDVIAHPDQHTVSLNENITKDGRRVLVNWVNHILTDEEGRHIGHLTMGYDVTEQKETEDKLHDAQRLAGIGQTAAMIGHDLRNPLQSLQYIVDLQKLRFDKIPPDKRSAEDWQKEEALFDYISEQVFYMDKIVSDLSDYARPIAPEHEEITIRTIIDDVLESIPPADGVEIVVDVRDQTFTVDPHLMVRVFSNLILNALQAMPHGGTLTIETEAFNDSVTIRVSDTGVGIPADMRDKLFSPLTTGKAKGTGLGLAVVKRIVEAHKGTITFESEKGKGTAFAVTLPAT